MKKLTCAINETWAVMNAFIIRLLIVFEIVSFINISKAIEVLNVTDVPEKLL